MSLKRINDGMLIERMSDANAGVDQFFVRDEDNKIPAVWGWIGSETQGWTLGRTIAFDWYCAFSREDQSISDSLLGTIGGAA